MNFGVFKNPALFRRLLYAVVFLTGASVLVVEILAIRVLAVYFGNTIYTTSSVLGIILMALSVGYAMGGRLADRHPSRSFFFSLIFGSGVSVLLLVMLRRLALPILGAALPLTWGPLVAGGFLFLVPGLLLGTLSPFAIKLAQESESRDRIGSVTGDMFFWSTSGSIAGSLLAGFYLMPTFGIETVLIGVGVFLILLGAVPRAMLGGITMRGLFIWGCVFVFGGALVSSTNAGSYTGVVRFQQDGVYEHVIVFDSVMNGRPARFLMQDKSNSGAMYLDGDDLAYDYSKYYQLYKLFTPELRTTLTLGAGAYSIPKDIILREPNAIADVVEIEPVLVEKASELFQVPETPRLRSFLEDGRQFLRLHDNTYDLIFSDVYFSWYSLPTHFTTREFFELARSRLNKGGIFAANIIGDLSRQEPSFLFTEIATFREVFPEYYVFAVESPERTGVQNVIVVGRNSDPGAPEFDFNSLRAHEDPFLRSLPDQLVDMRRFDLSHLTVLTDEYAPVDTMLAASLPRWTGQDTEAGLPDAELVPLVAQQLRYGPRYPGSQGHARMQEFLRSELSLFADEVSEESFTVGSSSQERVVLTNFIARFHSDNPRRFIVATHYDSKMRADRDRSLQPVPGANDSASGVATLLLLARQLEEARDLGVGVDLVFFDGEEGLVDQGLATEWRPEGSTYFAARLDQWYPAGRPEGALVVDMVCDRDLRISQESISLLRAPDLTRDFFQQARSLAPGVFSDLSGVAVKDDHVPLLDAGVPSTLIIDFEYPWFHTTKDTVDKCSRRSMKTVGDALFSYLQSL